MTEATPKLFICYRREEAASYAGRLYDEIAARFRPRHVFMDIELEPGIDFVERIVEVVGFCHVFLLIIGPRWATLSNDRGQPRIADNEDYVRLEVVTALRRRDVRVIPLLVGGARMPHPEELPEELRALTRRNALELSDLRWRYDVGRLMSTVEELLERSAVPLPARAKAIKSSAPRAPAEAKANTPEASRPKDRVGAEIAGHRLEAIIGRGETGVVYRAREIDLDRVVALKVIAPEFAERPEFCERFKRESEEAASIEHPNVLPIHRVGEEGNLLFITMDFVDGTDLKSFIGVRGRLDPALAAAIVAQVAAGLAAAHARELLHRDVKPANVLIDGQDHAYVTGFGITKRTGPGSALTETGLIVGTTDYLAPEQITGDKLDARTDVYALGCVLYEALTGFVPYPRTSIAATLRAHVNDPPPAVRDSAPDVPSEFGIVVRRAMAKVPTHRFISAEAMRRVTDAAARSGASRTGTAVAGKVASESTPAPPKPEVTSQPPVPERSADTHVASRHTAADGQSRSPTRSGLPVATAEAGADADAIARAPTGSRLSLRLLLAVAGLGLALVIAAVLLVTSGDREDSSTSNAVVSTPPAPPLPTGLKWRPIHDAPVRRQYAAATAVDGKVGIFGGIGRWGSALTGTKFYDPAQRSWKTGPGLQLPLHHCMAVTYRGNAVLIGGFEGGEELDELTQSQSNRVFELRDDGWHNLPPLKRPRAAGAAAVVGGKIVVVGGQANGELVTQTEVYDGDHWEDMAPMPTPREHLAAAADGRYVYAIGGRKLSADENYSTLERYDPVTDRWKPLKSMPIPTGGLGATYLPGRLIAAGGEGSTSASDAVWAYEIQTQRWSPLPKLPSARHGVAVTSLANSVYAVGGAADAKHVQSTQEVDVLNLSDAPAEAPATVAGGWEPIKGAPFPRKHAASTAGRGSVWLLGGIGEGETPSDKTASYDLAIGGWTGGADLPEPVDHLMAVTYKARPVVMGGFVEGAGPAPEPSDRVFEFRDDLWHKLPSLNRPRAAAAAAVVDGKIVVVGGQANGKLVAQTEVYDGKHWKDVKPIPTPREHLAAAADDRYVYAVGGRQLLSDKQLSTLERYDPVRNRWTKLKSMPTATGDVGAAFVRKTGRLITVMGGDASNTSGAAWQYETQTNEWAPLSNLTSVGYGAAVTGLGDTVYAIGGSTESDYGQPTEDAKVVEFDEPAP